VDADFLVYLYLIALCDGHNVESGGTMTNLLLFLAIVNGLVVGILGPDIGLWVWPGIVLEGVLVGFALAMEHVEQRRDAN